MVDKKLKALLAGAAVSVPMVVAMATPSLAGDTVKVPCVDPVAFYCSHLPPGMA